MSITESNEVLKGILDHLVGCMGKSTHVLKFEDFGIREELEPYFDGMVRWALREGLMRAEGTSGIHGSHTEFSYATIINPVITSTGIAVASAAAMKLDGNFMLATSIVKNPEMMKAIIGEIKPDSLIERENTGVMKLIEGP